MNFAKLLVYAATLAFLLPCGASEAAPARPAVVSVDMQALMTDSLPAQKGLEHLQKVQFVLENGYEELKDFHKNTAQEERDKIVAEGLAALQRQMAIEKLAVSKIIKDIIVEEVRIWRKANKVTLVINRESVVEGDMEHADFTSAILERVNKRRPVFPALPEVSINKSIGEKGKTPSAPAPGQP